MVGNSPFPSIYNMSCLWFQDWILPRNSWYYVRVPRKKKTLLSLDSWSLIIVFVSCLIVYHHISWTLRPYSSKNFPFQYCWCFRNPKEPVKKLVVNYGNINYQYLNWWVNARFLVAINTTPWFLEQKNTQKIHLYRRIGTHRFSYFFPCRPCCYKVGPGSHRWFSMTPPLSGL